MIDFVPSTDDIVWKNSIDTLVGTIQRRAKNL
jgi:hypothetical protein